MSTAVLDKIRAERDQARAAALEMAQADNFDPNDPTFKDLEARALELDDRAATLAGLLEKQAAADALDGRLAKSAKAAEEKSAQVRADQARPLTREASWGSVFTRSDLYKEYAQRARGQSGTIDIDLGANGLQTRALPTGVADLIEAGFLPTPTQVDVTPPAVPTPLLDNITTVNVSGNAIEYVSWAKVAGGADVVAEKAEKPSVEWAPEVTSDTLQNIAGYTQLTRQLMEDFASVQSLIDNQLRREVLLAEEREAAGVLAATTIPEAAGDDLLSAMRVGIGTVEAAGYVPNAAVINPADYAALDLQVMGITNQGPTVGSGYWGLSLIPSSNQPEGEVIVGDFRTGIQHFVRSQVQLYITDSHADTFLKNVFTLLAERRSKTAVVRPDALVSCSTGTGS